MEKLIVRLGKCMDILAGIFITFIMFLTVSDVVLRYLGMPILGTYELVSLAGALAVGISSFFTYWQKNHIRVETIVEKLPKNIGHILHIVTRAMILFIVGMTGLALIVTGFQLLEAQELTATLYLPYYPVVWAVGVSFLVVCLAVLYQIISRRGD